MLQPDLKSATHFKTGWPDLKWATWGHGKFI